MLSGRDRQASRCIRRAQGPSAGVSQVLKELRCIRSVWSFMGVSGVEGVQGIQVTLDYTMSNVKCQMSNVKKGWI